MFFRPTEDTDKTIRLGDSQMDVFTSGIGLTSGYVTIAPYGGGEYNIYTVSYTHLTLPTKRIV